MRVCSHLAYRSGICLAAAIIAGCGGNGRAGTDPIPMSPNAARPAPSHQEAPGHGSWMAPGLKKADLLYVTDDANPVGVDVLSDGKRYRRDALVGTLTAFSNPTGDCTDKSGDVFIVDEGAGTIVEYPHGGATPVATLRNPEYTGEGCSVDPATGDLAVANVYYNSSATSGGVAVYAPPYNDAPTLYEISDLHQAYFCSYDTNGDLFVDGYSNASNTFGLAELKRGGSSFKAISVNEAIGAPGGVQWTGKHLAIGDEIISTIYEFAIKKGRASFVDGTPLAPGGTRGVYQFAIQGDRVFAPNLDGGLGLQIFRFPTGGEAMWFLVPPYAPYSVALSKGSK